MDLYPSNVCVQKGLYGALKSELLLFFKLQKNLEEYRFDVNLDDPCVTNKININQVTVAWHVHDLKVLHKNL